MATPSRQSALFGIQDWKKFYQTFSQADFQSYDYETLRKSFIDYLTTYYPETFNDYIESSEFVALLDVMAFMGQALAFRNDLNARENFIDTAERRDSVIKLANLVGYTPKRNLAAQGLLKITAISTTENVVDVNGANLNNTTILWNDPANPSWQEQFNAIINATLVNSQRVGRPGNSNTILGVRTDEYVINVDPGQNPIIPFKSQIDGVTTDFELVSVTSVDSESLYELPPVPSSQFRFCYRNDKLGYGSPNTGFFFYFKQGTLQSNDFIFAEQIENNFQFIDISGVNNTDTWLYQLDEFGNAQTLWTQVDNVYYNTDPQTISGKKIFSVGSRFNDQVTYNFGDGVFGEIPVGNYRAYVRSSNGLTYTISPSEMQGVVVSFNYISRNNRVETLTVTLSLQSTVTNGQQSEPVVTIKERAPTQYYTQNRMVNGEDYSNFPFTQFNSIIKSTAVNRSSIGISRNLDLTDPTAKYSSINVFADDGALYTDDTSFYTTFGTVSINQAVQFLTQTLVSLLENSAVKQYYFKNFPRYSGYYTGGDSSDNKVYWNRSSTIGTDVTGYFYIEAPGDQPLPVGLGAFGGFNLEYITVGSQIKFVAPAGQYFDSKNRLQTGTPNVYAGDKTYIWAGVSQVIGDGKNFGNGNFSNGSGPVTLTTYVPTGAIIDYTTGAGATGIIASFSTSLGPTATDAALNYIRNKQNFYLEYNNVTTDPALRWTATISPSSMSNWIVYFEYSSINELYTVTIKNTNYYFGSVEEVRFVFAGTRLIYDSKSGQILNDFVNIIKTNNNPTNTSTLGQNYVLQIVDQFQMSDGYPDDFQIKVSSIDSNTGYSFDPDFFATVVGTSPSAWVFFQKFEDSMGLYRSQILPAGSVVSIYSTLSDINLNVYEYASGTLFYAYSEEKFYQSSTVPGTTPPVLQLTDVTENYYLKTGRNTINFQYRHNSDETTRIDPGTTNIIDLYVVTQSYYTQYQNWINDTTGTIPLPRKPTIDELQQLYGNLDKFKMLSDSVIFNSVTFKPLFGTKAEPALQGTIKIIKNPGVTVSDSQIRSSVLSALNTYFSLDKWNFGDTFYFSELTAYLHVQLQGLISSVIVTPSDPTRSFGDLYEVRCQPNEIFVNGATTKDIVVISALTPASMQRT